jgi:hypothetical protein
VCLRTLFARDLTRGSLHNLVALLAAQTRLEVLRVQGALARARAAGGGVGDGGARALTRSILPTPSPPPTTADVAVGVSSLSPVDLLLAAIPACSPLLRELPFHGA